MTLNKLALVAAMSAVLTACGGSSSGGGNSSPSSSSSSSSDASSPSSSAQSSSSGGGEYEGDWTACERFNTPQGFVTLGEGISGGADVGNGNYEVGATTGVAIKAALEGAEYADKPLTIYVDDLITWDNSNNDAISIRRDNVTLVGRADNAGFEGVGIELSHGASNVIIRNLELRLVPQFHSPGDLISLDGRDGAVSNIWIDHNDLYNSRTAPEGATCADLGESAGCELDKNYYDELVSGRSAVHNVTISYNTLHDSWKTSLWGSSDNSEEDAGRNITFHHNHWYNNNSRMPLFRYGEAHVFNNYYHNIDGSAVNARMGAEIRVDGNVFETVNHPITSQFSEERGFWDVEDNIFVDISASGTCPSTGGECKGAHEESTTQYTPGYTYDIMPSTEVKAYLTQYAGAGVIDDCLDLPEPSGDNTDVNFNTDPQTPPENWNAFDGSLMPNADGAITLATGGTAMFALGGDTDQDYFSLNGDGTLSIDTTADPALKHNATYRDIFAQGYPKHVTVVAGIEGVEDLVRLLEIEVAFSDEGETGSRLKTLLRNQDGAVGIQLEDAENGESVEYYDQLDMSSYHVYQIGVTMHNATHGNVRIYVDGSDDPVISLLNIAMRPASSAGDNFIRIGDGGGHPYKSTVDWLVWTTDSDYLPSDLKGAIPASLGNITGYEAE